MLECLPFFKIHFIDYIGMLVECESKTSLQADLKCYDMERDSD